MTELSEKHKYDNQPLEHHVTHLKDLVTSLELYIGEDDNYRFLNAVKAANVKKDAAATVINNKYCQILSKKNYIRVFQVY